MSRSNLFIITAILLAIFFCLPGANASESLSDTAWQQLTNDKAFGYRDEVEGFIEQKPNTDSAFAKIFSGILLFFASGFGRALIWLCFFGLLAWALFKIFISDKTSIFGKSRKKIDEEGELLPGDDLENVNWEKHLQEAIRNNDTRLIVRYSFMLLLQLLQQKELIQYRNDKTNHEYASELADSQYRQLFRQMSRQYEFAWYGHYTLSPQAYESYINAFNHLKNKLS